MKPDTTKEPQTFDEWVGFLSAHNFASKHPDEARAWLVKFSRWLRYDDQAEDARLGNLADVEMHNAYGDHDDER